MCCSLADCHRVDPGDVRVRGDTYEFKMEPDAWGNVADHRWHKIPSRVLIRGRDLAALGGNPTSAFVICAATNMPLGAGPVEFTFYCAVPPAGY